MKNENGDFEFKVSMKRELFDRLAKSHGRGIAEEQMEEFMKTELMQEFREYVEEIK